MHCCSYTCKGPSKWHRRLWHTYLHTYICFDVESTSHYSGIGTPEIFTEEKHVLIFPAVDDVCVRNTLARAYCVRVGWRRASAAWCASQALTSASDEGIIKSCVILNNIIYSWFTSAGWLLYSSASSNRLNDEMGIVYTNLLQHYVYHMILIRVPSLSICAAPKYTRKNTKYTRQYATDWFIS